MKLMKLCVLIVISILLLSGCAPVPRTYPEGATEFEKWQIDRYYEDRIRQRMNDIPQMSLPVPYCQTIQGLQPCP